MDHDSGIFIFIYCGGRTGFETNFSTGHFPTKAQWKKILTMIKDYDQLHKIWGRAHSAGSPTKFTRNMCVYKALKQLIPGNTLDAGCGKGEYSLFLSELGHGVTAFDPSAFAIKNLQKSIPIAANIFMEENTIDKFSSPKAFDNIVSIEVLEHIESDQAAIQKLYSLLKKGGTLVISIPANPLLFSEGDRVSGHYRRYRHKDFKKLLDNAGFKSITIKSYGFPILFIYSCIKKLFLDKYLIQKFSSQSPKKNMVNWLYHYYPLIFSIDQLDLPRLGIGYIAICKK
jgi:SAM-dependent methyltransferase